VAYLKGKGKAVPL